METQARRTKAKKHRPGQKLLDYARYCRMLVLAHRAGVRIVVAVRLKPASLQLCRAGHGRYLTEVRYHVQGSSAPIVVHPACADVRELMIILI